jgi:UDP-N-acetylmuramoylalanine--D-glutamate ligase
MGARVRVADTRDDPPGAAQLAALGSACELTAGAGFGKDGDALFRDAELIVASPGVAVAGPARDPAIARAIAQGKKFVGDVELFAWEQNEIGQKGQRPKMIGITGSNGKSTVTAMAGAMCRAAGLRTVVAGNIGLPVLEAAQEAREQGQPDVYVVELSSFQLETTSSLHLDAATMLNLSQDHLDRYYSMEDYAAAKKRIFLHAAHQVLNRQDAASMAMQMKGPMQSSFGVDETFRGDFQLSLQNQALCEKHDPFVGVEELKVTGNHNALNALAAYALCRAIGLPSESLVQGLMEFKGLPHRVENVGSIDGVTYYDDSKGTNVGSTVAALNGMTVPVVLIAGGIGKEQDFSPLTEPVRKRARAVVLIGKDARLIESAITGARVDVLHATSMEDAVAKAHRVAQVGDAVLLSPACSSFDMFRNYNHRGEVFARCVRELKAKVDANPEAGNAV